jgi:hypothetical protein
MHRFAIASLAVPLALLLAAGPVAADTGPGGSGTHFASFGEVCTSSGNRQVCTDTSLFVDSNGDGTFSGCVDIMTFAISSTGRGSFVSDKYGCNSNVTLSVGSDYSVAMPSTNFTLQTCSAHKQCSGSTTSTVSANDTVVGPVSTTTTRSTTVSGNCTTRTTTTDTFASLTGTITIDGSSVDEQGSVDVVKESFTIRCK